MTNFDEEMMKRALREAADDFAIADSAVERILDEAREAAHPDESHRIRAFIQRTGRVQSTFMAGGGWTVGVAVAVPLFNAESPTKQKNAVIDVHGQVFLNSRKSVNAAAPGLATTGTG